ncbi:hypothetical protein HUG15_09865 [Salicibibacter cibarius]|uniref:Core-binding (CB) domain-containing protein n=1 Tax=Salicibibacter cibarius TaxID=2743000 RepID=A0A7T7CBI0_9BACI|nr:N-terminal phage integrase SAM-like domain-containing protein [Salicibibacter cibarius]QQK75844.1 hypothetical protein HUG15_09865 [Salicibibacter cibarius]
MERTFTFEGDRDPTFEELFYGWREVHKLQLKQTTITNTEGMFKNHILPHFGKMKIKKITRGHCQEFIKKMSPGTVQPARTKVTMIFRYAIQENIISKNPMDYVVMPKKVNWN